MAGSLGDTIAQAAAGRLSEGVRAPESQDGRLLSIPTADVRPDPKQPREDLGDLDGLVASIEAYGIQSPIVVSPMAGGHFMLIAGHRRHAAAVRLELPTVPAIVRTVEDHARLELQLIENVQRKDFNALEEARAYRRLMDEFNVSQGEVAKRVGKARKTINDALRILDLPVEMQADYHESSEVQAAVSSSLMVLIARAPKRDQEAMWRRARTGTLTVAAARKQRVEKGGDVAPGRSAREKRTAVLGEAGVRVSLTVERLPGVADPLAKISVDELILGARTILEEISGGQPHDGPPKGRCSALESRRER